MASSQFQVPALAFSSSCCCSLDHPHLYLTKSSTSFLTQFKATFFQMSFPILIPISLHPTPLFKKKKKKVSNKKALSLPFMLTHDSWHGVYDKCQEDKEHDHHQAGCDSEFLPKISRALSVPLFRHYLSGAVDESFFLGQWAIRILGPCVTHSLSALQCPA